jgi:hypothetical protein
MNVRQLVRDTVGLQIIASMSAVSSEVDESTHDVATHGGPTIGTNYHSSVELNGHDRGLAIIFSPNPFIVYICTYTKVNLAVFESVHIWMVHGG